MSLGAGHGDGPQLREQAEHIWISLASGELTVNHLKDMRRAEPDRLARGRDTQEGAAVRAHAPARPSTFRWRPWQQFATVLGKTHATDVPVDEWATFRAQVVQLRERLQALEAEFGEV